MHHIQIRFNTDSMKNPDLNLPNWRVLIDGKEHLARHVKLEVGSETTTDLLPEGILKHHVTCSGVTEWDATTETLTVKSH